MAKQLCTELVFRGVGTQKQFVGAKVKGGMPISDFPPCIFSIPCTSGIRKHPTLYLFIGPITFIKRRVNPVFNLYSPPPLNTLAAERYSQPEVALALF